MPLRLALVPRMAAQFPRRFSISRRYFVGVGGRGGAETERDGKRMSAHGIWRLRAA